VSIRALIVDDEPLGRQRIRSLLKEEADLEVVGECADGLEAVAAIRDRRPDLVFLDVQMPGLDGFGVLEAVGPEQMPAVIFVTAHDAYALRAFEVHALDYLLKPFDRRRLRQTLQRARQQLNQGEKAVIQYTALLQDVQVHRKFVDRLVIKSAGRVFFLKTGEIDWIEAAGNYVRLHVGDEVHLLRETMSNLETRLNSGKFLRIHRSTMVNIERVKELRPMFHGDYLVLLHDGTELTLSRSYRPKLQELLGDSI
jgi:two-component system, LytTR family, response regulator